MVTISTMLSKTKKSSVKKKGRKIKRGLHPFANINWDKATLLFKDLPKQEKEPGRYPSTREILSIVAVAGIVGLIFAFPPVVAPIAALVRLGNRDYQGWGMRRTIKRLKKQKYVSVKEHTDGRVEVCITKQGMAKALMYQLDDMKLIEPKRWDKKWRELIFDVPEKYKHLRDIFRMRLVQLGLYQLQESVYVSPYPCFDEVEFLRELYGIAFTVQYLLVERIEDDALLRTHFDLPS